MQFKAPPQNELELLNRCYELAGKTFADLAEEAQQMLPDSFKRAKGFIGQLIETHLGASAGNKPLPDFTNLGIELKTLPYNRKGEPQETTYVCTAPLSQMAAEENWKNSRVYKKLKRLLWIPIEADPSIAIAERKVGSPLLFKLDQDPTLEAILKKDWEELMDMLHLGKISELSASHGQYLHIRPKAAHSRILAATLNHLGEEEWVGPKGFYLRMAFTSKLLREHYCF
jgi:DNA mismatch repair protein MutH